MKTIMANRGGQIEPLKRKFDTFDSIITIYDSAVKEIYSVPFANTDFCNGYNGGILAEGDYGFICGMRGDTNQKVIFLFDKKYYLVVNTREQLTEPMRVLPSLIPNPNNGNTKTITQVLVHCDGPEGGWSHGCQTVFPDYWQDFIDCFSINEKGIYCLDRADDWKVPSFYQGK